MFTHNLPVYIVCFVANGSVGTLHGFDTEYYNIFAETRALCFAPW